MAFPPPRPQGTPPFVFINRMYDVFVGEGDLGKVTLVSGKRDGWCVRIQWLPDGSDLAIYTRNGMQCLPTGKGTMGVIGKVFKEKFSHLDPHKLTHPTYGRASALYGEFFVFRDDLVSTKSRCRDGLEDLRPLMHGTGLEGRSFGLELFWCSFRADNPALTVRPEITWAERLALCKTAFGPWSIVRVYVDTSGILGVGTAVNRFFALEECYNFGEGLVYMEDGKFYKVKADRPVGMLLVAVGFTKVKGRSIPTHFFWGVRDPSSANTFAVLLVEDMRYLFDDKRSASSKLQLSVDYVLSKNDHYSYKGGRPNYFGRMLNAHFEMVSGVPLIHARSTETRRVKLNDGRTLVIGQNRSARFTGFERLLFPSKPECGVISYNASWMTGSSNTVYALHFQAPKLVATNGYGHPVFRALLDRPQPISAEKLIELATTTSRALFEHTRVVYGPEAPNLTYGVEYEEEEGDGPVYKRDPDSGGESSSSEESDEDSSKRNPSSKKRSYEEDIMTVKIIPRMLL